MRHLVTGGAGFIGSHLCQTLIDRGEQATALDDLSGGTTMAQLDRWWRGYDIDLWRFPVEDLRATDGPFDVVWHLASPVGPVGVLGQAGRIATAIIDDASYMADLSHLWGATMIDVSTSELYGPQPGAAAETSDCVFVPAHSARQEYAVGKLAAEVMLLNREEVDLRIIRPFNVAGPRQRPGGGFVIPRWIEQWRKGEPLTVYGTGHQKRSFTHVADFVDGMLAAWGHGERERYNVANPHNLATLTEAAELFIDIAGSGTIAYVDPTDLHGPGFREAPDKWGAIGRAVSVLDWLPTRSLADIISDALEAEA